MAQGEASCSSFCQASWLARNNRSRGGEGCWALVPTVALMEVMVGACPHAACPGAAVPARVPAQHLLSLHSEAAFRRAVLHCGCASWLQNPFLEPYGKTELCQTVWPVLFVFLFFFFPFALAASWRRIPRQQSYKHASGEGCVELGLPGFPALFVRAFYV